MAFLLKSRIWLFSSVLSTCFLLNTCQASSADSTTVLTGTEVGFARFLYVPLLDKTFGNMSVHEVPVLLHGKAPASIVEVMGAPVFPASLASKDQTSDINLISLANIRMMLTDLADERGYDLTIDLSNAQKPSGAKAGIEDIVQAIITCLRLQFPQSWYGRINIKLVGISEGDTSMKKMQGPLWHSD